MSSEDYTSKYLKYKNKYLKLKQNFLNSQSGGGDGLERLSDTPSQTEVYGRRLKQLNVLQDGPTNEEPKMSGGTIGGGKETTTVSDSSDFDNSSSSDSSTLSSSTGSPLQSSPITSEMNASLTLSSLKSEL
jgi:hypothetical protein